MYFRTNSKLDVLSLREKEILQELVNGCSCKSIADNLYISEHTARTHVKNIYMKLDVHSGIEAVSLAVKEGMYPVRKYIQF